MPADDRSGAVVRLPERKPLTFTEEQIDELETLGALLTKDQVADYFGLSRTTIYRMFRRQPEAEERYKKGKAKAIAHVARGLLMKARRGDTTSQIFFLKTQAGWRETNRLEVTNPDGSLRPPPSIDPSKLSTAALEEILALMDEGQVLDAEAVEVEGEGDDDDE